MVMKNFVEKNVNGLLVQKNSMEILNELFKEEKITREDIYQLMVKKDISSFTLDKLALVFSRTKSNFNQWIITFDMKRMLENNQLIVLEISIVSLLHYVDFNGVDFDTSEKYYEAICNGGYKTILFITVKDSKRFKFTGSQFMADSSICNVVSGREYLYACKKAIDNQIMSANAIQECVCSIVL